MSLYAIGDLHLHFQTELKAKAQIRDRAWRNHEQKVALEDLIVSLLIVFPTIKKISGHRDYANKACPCFDAKKEYKVLLKEL